MTKRQLSPETDGDHKTEKQTEERMNGTDEQTLVLRLSPRTNSRKLTTKHGAFTQPGSVTDTKQIKVLKNKK